MRHVFVPGRPAPQGSKSPKGRTRSGRVILVESSKAVKPWREAIAWHARSRGGIMPGPIAVEVTFIMPRPKSLPKSKPTPPCTVRPDLDKLLRAVFDALTGIWWTDDSHVTAVRASKRTSELGEQSGCQIVARHIGAGSENVH